MVDRILRSLEKIGITVWKLQMESINAVELFFIKKDLDMKRVKDVKNYSLTVYRDFEQDHRKFRGSAQIALFSSLSDEEIVSKIQNAFYTASFVRNPWFPLPRSTGYSKEEIREKSSLAEKDLNPVLKMMIDSLFKNDNHREGGINSAEIFINRKDYRFINSSGIDVSYTTNEGIIELICEWTSQKDSVELYNLFSFSDMNSTMIEDECRTQIENCRLRAEALDAPSLQDINIILTGESVRDVMNFYLYHSNVKNVYDKTARAEQGQIFQGKDNEGDLVSIFLEPSLPNSPFSAPYDPDGVKLERTELFKDGMLLRQHGSQQYSSYLGVVTTGSFKNITVESGSSSLEQWRQKPHVEIRAFSDFQMDPLTGDFGGEIRLAVYYDGKTYLPVTGATLSASLFDVQKRLFLSSERQIRAGFDGPAALMYPGGTLGGS